MSIGNASLIEAGRIVNPLPHADAQVEVIRSALKNQRDTTIELFKDTVSKLNQPWSSNKHIEVSA